MGDERALRRIVGLADACELLARATAFPDEALASALSDGRLVGDARSCLEDCGVPSDEASAACELWENLAGESSDALLSDLKRAHSLLFVRQGDGVAVWPYESAFIHVESGKEGEPAMFRSPIALSVEKAMRAAGVLPSDSRVEPCDSAWDEFMFLAYLLGSEAEALDSGDEEAATTRRGQIASFVEEHACRWLPAFFDVVARELPSIASPASCSSLFYTGLCSYGTCAMGVLQH